MGCIERLLGKYAELNLRHFLPIVFHLRARVEHAAGRRMRPIGRFLKRWRPRMQ